ncbi:hypothetical protein SAMN04488694_11429 [Natrinema hispanicum]|uniref:Uncharacterized protein n=1 Tax=Natrinema hispanicum TaxID=392421 RepID=A0A1I0HL83_9EURY|nr:hypothetical protein SAMN04488694_11429 [Natrinema hispanicum]
MLFGVDGTGKGTGVPEQFFSEDELEVESIRGKCPECGERRSLKKKRGGDRVEIHCEACETELLEYEGEQTVTGVNFYEEVGGHSVSFAQTG